MRDHIEEPGQTRSYDDFLARKVNGARADKAAGQHHAHEEVEAEFATRRTEALREGQGHLDPARATRPR